MSQGNRAMQRVFFTTPNDSLIVTYLLEASKGQGRYSTSSHLLSKSRLNMKPKQINYNTIKYVF